MALSCDKNIVHDDTEIEKDNSDFVENISKLLHKKYLEYIIKLQNFICIE